MPAIVSSVTSTARIARTRGPKVDGRGELRWQWEQFPGVPNPYSRRLFRCTAEWSRLRDRLVSHFGK